MGSPGTGGSLAARSAEPADTRRSRSAPGRRGALERPAWPAGARPQSAGSSPNHGRAVPRWTRSLRAGSGTPGSRHRCPARPGQAHPPVRQQMVAPARSILCLPLRPRRRSPVRPPRARHRAGRSRGGRRRPARPLCHPPGDPNDASCCAPPADPTTGTPGRGVPAESPQSPRRDRSRETSQCRHASWDEAIVPGPDECGRNAVEGWSLGGCVALRPFGVMRHAGPMSLPFPEPTVPVSSRSEVFLGYLDYFRSRLLSKLDAMPASELHSSRLPSGWMPVELLKHLAHVELRWLEWGFEGRAVDDPWADSRDDRWFVAADETFEDLAAALRTQGARTRKIVESHDLADIGQPGERWDGADPPALERVMFHLLQEYARHIGHLDVVAELADGQTGE